MTALADLNKSINNVLRESFEHHKIYAGEVTEGFRRPSFFTQVLPQRMDYETTNYKSERLMVAITYFNESDTELENIRAYDKLVNAFGMTLKVKDRRFLLGNIRSTNADGALQFSFDLNYWSQLSNTEEHELMEELDLKNRQE